MKLVSVGGIWSFHTPITQEKQCPVDLRHKHKTTRCQASNQTVSMSATAQPYAFEPKVNQIGDGTGSPYWYKNFTWSVRNLRVTYSSCFREQNSQDIICICNQHIRMILTSRYPQIHKRSRKDTQKVLWYGLGITTRNIPLVLEWILFSVVPHVWHVGVHRCSSEQL